MSKMSNLMDEIENLYADSLIEPDPASHFEVELVRLVMDKLGSRIRSMGYDLIKRNLNE